VYSPRADWTVQAVKNSPRQRGCLVKLPPVPQDGGRQDTRAQEQSGSR
jgi:hypothetical protein